jgi:hypothetical protein
VDECYLGGLEEGIRALVRDSVEPGSVIHTDRSLGYLPLEKKGYEHEVTFLRAKRKTPSN